jgi:hypothetical protein
MKEHCCPTNSKEGTFSLREKDRMREGEGNFSQAPIHVCQIHAALNFH